jgi:hypothetical protein
MTSADGVSGAKGLVRRVASRLGAHLRRADERAVGQELGSHTAVSSSQPATLGEPRGERWRTGGTQRGRLSRHAEMTKDPLDHAGLLDERDQT